jgi:diketogulonate reductase-like aldo/keto reductase
VLKRSFGWTGIKVPVIGQGTWRIECGLDEESNPIEALRLGLKLGLTHIDTAEMYGRGRIEKLVAEAITGQRDKVFLVSKVLPSHASYEGTIRACKRSLKRLKTEWLDLYLLHWPGNIPINETMHAMEELVKEGLIQFIGVSNFDVEELQAAENALRDQRIACNQVFYHLGYRGIERRLLPYCTDQQIAVVGYSPFGHGNFQSTKSTGGQKLAEISKRHGRTPRQVALNFLTRNHNVFTIPKTAHPSRIKENCGSKGWDLTDEDVITIDQAFPVQELDTPLHMI